MVKTKKVLPPHLSEIKSNDELVRILCSDDRYQIMSDGKIFTLVQTTGKVSKSGEWRELIAMTTKDGYSRYRYCYKYLSIHRIVYQKFVGDLDFTKQVNHIDGNPRNNTPDNLRLVVQSVIQTHSYRVMNRKTVTAKVKLSLVEAERIRTLKSQGVSVKNLIEMFKVSRRTIGSILKNESWKVTNALV